MTLFLTEVKKPDGEIEVFELYASDIRHAVTRSYDLFSHIGKIGCVRNPNRQFLVKHYATVMLIA